MKTNKDIAVVIGRFQVSALHTGHRYLIDSVNFAGNQVLVLIGVNGAFPSRVDPLDFETRKQMILRAYPNAQVAQIADHPCDEYWSSKVDEVIEGIYPEHNVTLYGSRDSFIPHYTGKFKCKIIPPFEGHSASSFREEIAKCAIDSEDFRKGIIYAAHKNYPTSFQAVDVVIKHSLEDKVIVGRKKGESGWRFPGGFVEPKDMSLEAAAKREAIEEVGDIEIADVKYISSIRVHDHRYRKSEHKIMTALFSSIYVFGCIEPRDDIDEVRWQSIDGLVDCLAPCHKPLGEAFIKTMK